MALNLSVRIFLQRTHANKKDPQALFSGWIIHQLLLVSWSILALFSFLEGIYSLLKDLKFWSSKKGGNLTLVEGPKQGQKFPQSLCFFHLKWTQEQLLDTKQGQCVFFLISISLICSLLDTFLLHPGPSWIKIQLIAELKADLSSAIFWWALNRMDSLWASSGAKHDKCAFELVA